MYKKEIYTIPNLQLLLRFFLEILGLIAYAVWGWSLGGGAMSWVNVLIVPGFVAFLWGTFNVPGDASRSGTAMVRVPGWVRLALELAIFTGAAFTMVATGKPGYAVIYGAAVAVHYLTSLDRVKWLLTQ